jgi:hypothetical protein
VEINSKKCIKHTGIDVTYLQMVLVLINFQGIEWYVHLANSNTKWNYVMMFPVESFVDW